MTDYRYGIGMRKLRELYGEVGESVIAGAAEVFPAFAQYVVESYGDIYTRTGLDSRTRELTVVTALATLGHGGMPLKVHLHGALNAGCSREQIIETLMAVSLYIGVPAALSALSTAKDVFRERDLFREQTAQPHNR